MLHDRTVAAARDSAQAILADVGLADYVDAPVGNLTVGLLKRLEVARALALRPRLVLFDEIMAGLTPTEVRGMTNLVAGLPARGITVIWVEHVLYAIMKTAHAHHGAHRGELIADGAPEAMRQGSGRDQGLSRRGDETLLEVENLDAFYGPVQVLHDINLAVDDRADRRLVGANAAGKSTLMFTLAGLRTAYTGRILASAGAHRGICRPTSASCAASCWCRNGVGCFRS